MSNLCLYKVRGNTIWEKILATLNPTVTVILDKDSRKLWGRPGRRCSLPPSGRDRSWNNTPGPAAGVTRSSML